MTTDKKPSASFEKESDTQESLCGFDMGVIDGKLRFCTLPLYHEGSTHSCTLDREAIQEKPKVSFDKKLFLVPVQAGTYDEIAFQNSDAKELTPDLESQLLGKADTQKIKERAIEIIKRDVDKRTPYFDDFVEANNALIQATKEMVFQKLRDFK